ncbi:phage tail tape measure protein [Amaricoccus macauensis]|uniref:phage tail tape measure protein n=1 Tax=Amaricoccus macauensis TaxID=57001 RepID=UPI003C7E93C0
MTDFDSEFDRLEGQFSGLEDSFGGLESVAGAFRKELQGVRSSFEQTGQEASGMSKTVSSSIKSAFEGVIFDGERLSDALKSLGSNLASSTLRQAISPVQQAVGSKLGGGLSSILSGILPFADGAAFSGGRVAAFAKGGIVNGPTSFPMRGGTGLMGEAGPEAIMPLTRGADGTLGVRGGGSGAVNLTMNIATTDLESFQKSRSQIAADMSRALQRGRRNL